MSLIENLKSYTGTHLDTIFFRPMLTGDSAEDLGIRVLYNMPTPTVLHFWRGNNNVLKKLDSTGWKGGSPSNKFQKVMHLQRVKAECGYSASDYFSTVFELIASRADVNYEDLSGTELAGKYDGRIYSRIIGADYTVLRFEGNDYRVTR